MKINFLGTGAGMPSKQRNVTSIILDTLQEQNSLWMFDCGEATQHQLLHTSLKSRKVSHIFITHLHGDHIFGLPGFLSSRSFQGGKEAVTIYGPKGLKAFIETSLQVSQSRLAYPILIKEVTEGKIYENDQFQVFAKRLDHGIDSYGYRIEQKNSPGQLQADKLKQRGVAPGPIYQQFKTQDYVTLPDGETVATADFIGKAKKGKHVAILGDTRTMKETVDFVAHADLLVHEATFSKDQERIAYDYYHTTTTQAASLAQQAVVKQLILTHISSRFQLDQTEQLLAEAQCLFPQTAIASDFSSFIV
ncbi:MULTISPECIES: ribonuclease Z [Gracilibacillus]|uniref:ribonuclease Z n=1 Tax=Gracilibacillus TaxID=74385 RepID=UPI0008257B6C|nr:MULTISPECIES: ribonuclease Z [Gracilibacillus]